MKRAPFQFSLKSMLVVTTAAALFCAVFFSVPIVIRLTMVFMINSVVLYATIIYATIWTGYVRAFAIGALAPVTVSFFFYAGGVSAGLFGMHQDSPEIRLNLAAYAAVSFAAILLGGGVGAFFRWLAQSVSPPSEKPSTTGEASSDVDGGN